MLTVQQELVMAGTMRALAIAFEGGAGNSSQILYQAVVGWNTDSVGERCRFIDASNCDGVFALFDPARIEKGPVSVGICIRDGEQVRLELGTLWQGLDKDRTMLVTAKGRSSLFVEHGRFTERPGSPAKDLARGRERARRRVAILAAESIADGSFLVAA